MNEYIVVNEIRILYGRTITADSEEDATSKNNYVNNMIVRDLSKYMAGKIPYTEGHWQVCAFKKGVIYD